MVERSDNQMVGFQLRLRERLRAQLADAAKDNGNSLNAEIVERLARSLERESMIDAIRTVMREEAKADELAFVTELIDMVPPIDAIKFMAERSGGEPILASRPV